MGRKSVRENKNRYQLSREAAGLSREQASEKAVFVSEDRIEKIEGGKSLPHPDEVLALSEAYGDVLLCNHHCSFECPIGMKYINPVTKKDLSNITLSIINSVNYLEKQKDRLIEIAVDDKISPDEIKDFEKIKTELDNLAMSVDTLRLCVDSMYEKKKESE